MQMSYDQKREGEGERHGERRWRMQNGGTPHYLSQGLSQAAVGGGVSGAQCRRSRTFRGEHWSLAGRRLSLASNFRQQPTPNQPLGMQTSACCMPLRRDRGNHPSATGTRNSTPRMRIAANLRFSTLIGHVVLTSGGDWGRPRLALMCGVGYKRCLCNRRLHDNLWRCI